MKLVVNTSVSKEDSRYLWVMLLAIVGNTGISKKTFLISVGNTIRAGWVHRHQ